MDDWPAQWGRIDEVIGALTEAGIQLWVRLTGVRVANPLLIAAGFDRTHLVIPWLGGKRLRLVFG